MKGKSLSCVRFLVTPWTAARQAPPSMGFSRQEYWSGVPLSSPDRVQGPLIQTDQETEGQNPLYPSPLSAPGPRHSLWNKQP